MSGGGTNWKKKIAQPEICEFSFIWGLRTIAQETASLVALMELLQSGSGRSASTYVTVEKGVQP